jgi:hypothetical protein
MKIPLVFAAAGVLSGALALMVARQHMDAIYLAGVLFAGALGCAIWMAQRECNARIPAGRVIKALLPVAAGFPVLVWLLIALTVSATQVLRVLLGQPGHDSESLPIGYWAVLPVIGASAAWILWQSLRMLVLEPKVVWLRRLVGTAIVVCLLVIAADAALILLFGIPVQSGRRTWANFALLFLLGSAIVSLVYGMAVQERFRTHHD